MGHDVQDVDHSAETEGNLLTLALLALVAGAATGVLGAMFRLTLARADLLRNLLIDWAHGEGVAGFLFVVVACGAATFLASWLVRRFAPQASGSGIPYVEAVLCKQVPPASFLLVPVKFIGGVLAIGAGLALGREGPSVQIGAGISYVIGRTFGLRWPDCRVQLAAGAGAGLATAFNAPIAGAVFVLELVQRFEHRIAIACLGASAAAIAVARVFLGEAPDFHVAPIDYASAEVRPLFYVLGAVAGLLAIAYNRTLLAALGTADRLARVPVEARAALIGTAVGMLAWFAPSLVGGGDEITQRTLAGAENLELVPLVFLLRFGLGAVSYAAGAPGGLFAPLLVLGAQSGLLFGSACRLAFPHLDIQPEGFAIVGMAAFFTGVVRAPITGIALVIEMTGNVTLLLPMLGACFAAMLVPTLLRDKPIYEVLREYARHRE